MPPHIVSAEEVVIFNICVVSLYSATKFLLELPSKILVILVLLLLASVSINIRYKNGISIDVDPYIIITEKLDLFNISLNKYSEILLESINVLLFNLEEGNYFTFTNASLDSMRATLASTIISNPLGFFASPSRQFNCTRCPTLEALLFYNAVRDATTHILEPIVILNFSPSSGSKKKHSWLPQLFVNQMIFEVLAELAPVVTSAISPFCILETAMSDVVNM